LPVLTKKNLQPLTERLSTGYSRKMSMSAKHRDLAEILSSLPGTNTSSLFWASTAYRYGWYGIDLNKSYQARFYGIPMDFIGYQKKELS
jgi:phenylacetate-CoA ligase